MDPEFLLAHDLVDASQVVLGHGGGQVLEGEHVQSLGPRTIADGAVEDRYALFFGEALDGEDDVQAPQTGGGARSRFWTGRFVVPSVGCHIGWGWKGEKKEDEERSDLP